MPRSTILDLLVVSCFGVFCFVFMKLPKFPEWLYHFTFATGVHEGSSFSPSSPAFIGITMFYLSYSDRRVFLSHCGLNLNFSAVKHHFMCLLVICTSSLEKYLSHFPIFVFENFCPLTISNISIIT